jgi:hypothetical protein
MIGGAIFCGGYYWWMYIFAEPEIQVDGVYFEAPIEGTTMFGGRRAGAHDIESGWNGKANEANTSQEVRMEGPTIGG